MNPKKDTELMPFVATKLEDIPENWRDFLLSDEGIATMASYLSDTRQTLLQFRRENESALVEYVEYVKCTNGQLTGVALGIACASYVRTQPLLAPDGTIHADIIDAVRMIAHIVEDDVVILPPFIRLDKCETSKIVKQLTTHCFH